jgi:hypothetical protein
MIAVIGKTYWTFVVLISFGFCLTARLALPPKGFIGLKSYRLAENLKRSSVFLPLNPKTLHAYPGEAMRLPESLSWYREKTRRSDD